MRKDMGRVVIERPRNGSSNRSLKVRRVGRFIKDEDGLIEFDGPLRVPSSGSGMLGMHGKLGEKSFTDVLGPIHGYLASKVGEKWDTVWSEIAHGLGSFSWPLEHIMRFHIDVRTHTWMGEDGRIYAAPKRGGAYYCVSDPASNPDYYVHPVTRTLERAQERRYSPWWRDQDAQRFIKVSAGGDRWYVFSRGNWFIGVYKRREFVGAVRDGRFGITYPDLKWPDYRITHGKEAGSYFFTVVKSANKRECAEARRLLADQRRGG